MQVRLAFAVMIQVDADVLLIDEVLAVGDAAFQQKCFDTFARAASEAARTIVLVTHDMAPVERFCDRAMLLERGELVEIGDPARVARGLHARSTSTRERGARIATSRRRVSATAAVEILDAWFADSEGRRVRTSSRGGPCSFDSARRCAATFQRHRWA